jgi:division protein CdvB (Snf7/Vps24/ESCRT-III family)
MKHFASYMMLAALLVAGTAVRAEDGRGLEVRKDGPRPPLKVASTTPGRPGDRQPEMRNASSTREKPESDSRQKGMEKELGTMVSRIDATIGRMQDLITRTESRIAKTKAIASTTTDGADKLIADAKAKLLAAQTDFVSLKTAISTTTVDTTASSTRPTKEATKTLKKLTDKITKELQSIQTSLLKAVASLEPKGPKKGDDKRPMGSTTPDRIERNKPQDEQRGPQQGQGGRQ